MEREYSLDVKGKVIAYSFTTFEKNTIAEALRPMLKKWDKKIDKIACHPKNEGQATYACEIDRLFNEKKDLEGIIEEFKKK